MTELPDDARRRTEASGPDGIAWLAALPGHVSDLRAAWSLTMGEVLAGGKAAYVARVRTADGGQAVLKVAPPWDDFAGQVRTIAAAAGRGYVRLYRYDLVRNAALLERLGPGLPAAGLPVPQVIDILAATLLQAWQVPRPDGLMVAQGEYKAAQLARLVRQLWPELGMPCSGRLIDHALAYADRRVAAFDLARCVLCHGDPHPANAQAVLRPRPGAESGYVFIDPDGFLADPGYDLGVVVRGWTGQVLAASDPVALLRGYCRRLAAATGVDEQAIWEWGFVERVSSGLYLMRYGHESEGRQYLASAECLVRRGR